MSRKNRHKKHFQRQLTAQQKEAEAKQWRDNVTSTTEKSCFLLETAGELEKAMLEMFITEHEKFKDVPCEIKFPTTVPSGLRIVDLANDCIYKFNPDTRQFLQTNDISVVVSQAVIIPAAA